MQDSGSFDKFVRVNALTNLCDNLWRDKNKLSPQCDPCPLQTFCPCYFLLFSWQALVTSSSSFWPLALYIAIRHHKQSRSTERAMRMDYPLYFNLNPNDWSACGPMPNLPGVSGTQQNVLMLWNNNNGNQMMSTNQPEWHGGVQKQFTGHGSKREILWEMDQRKGLGWNHELIESKEWVTCQAVNKQCRCASANKFCQVRQITDDFVVSADPRGRM